jgi:hypothetical protein
MKTRTYISEGHIEEIEIPTGGLLKGDYRVEHRLFNFKGDPDEHDCMNVFKADVHLASIFFNDSIGAVCVHRFGDKVCFRKETVCLIYHIMDNWEQAMRDLPLNHASVLYKPEETE